MLGAWLGLPRNLATTRHLPGRGLLKRVEYLLSRTPSPLVSTPRCSVGRLVATLTKRPPRRLRSLTTIFLPRSAGATLPEALILSRPLRIFSEVVDGARASFSIVPLPSPSERVAFVVLVRNTL